MHVFIADVAQFRRFLELPVPAGITVVTGDFQVHHEAGRLNLPVLDLWDGYGDEEAGANDLAAWSYCEAMAGLVAGRVVRDGCDLVERMKYELFYPVRFAIHADAMVRRCMDRHPPESVACFGRMSRSFSWDPVDQPSDVFNAAVTWVAEQRGIAIQHVSEGSPPAEPSAGDGTGLQECRPSRAAFALPSRVHVVSVCPAYDYKEQELLLERMAEERSPSWMAIGDSEPAASIRLPQIRFESVLWLPYATDQATAAARQLASIGLPPAAGMPDHVRLALANPHLRFVWSHFCRSVEASARSHAMGSLLGRALRPALVLHGDDTWGAARCFMAGLWSCGTHTLANQHGGLGHDYSCRRHIGVRGAALCWGEFDGSSVRKWRDPSATVDLVGSLRRDTEDLLRSSAERAQPAQGTGRQKVVLLTTRVADMACPLASVTRHRATWEALLALCRGHPEWDFVIKPHPRYDYREVYEDWCRSGRQSNLSVAVGPARHVLEGAAAAVLVNYPSSVAVDACALRIPLVYLKPATYSWAPALLEGTGVIVADDVPALDRALSDLIQDAAARETCLEKQDDFLRRAVVGVGSVAVAKAALRVEAEADAAPTRDPPDGALRWVLDMIAAIEGSLLARARGRAMSDEFERLRQRGARVHFEAQGLLHLRETGEYLLGLVTGWPYFCPSAESRVRIVRLVFRALPAGLRPSWGGYRVYLSQAFHQEGGIRFKSREMAAWLLEGMSLLLAPGRLLGMLGRTRATRLGGGRGGAGVCSTG